MSIQMEVFKGNLEKISEIVHVGFFFALTPPHFLNSGVIDIIVSDVQLDTIFAYIAKWSPPDI